MKEHQHPGDYATEALQGYIHNIKPLNIFLNIKNIYIVKRLCLFSSFTMKLDATSAKLVNLLIL